MRKGSEKHFKKSIVHQLMCRRPKPLDTFFLLCVITINFGMDEFVQLGSKALRSLVSWLSII